VILGVDPENGDDLGLLFAGSAPRQLHGGDRFEKREERAAEHSSLLAGHDGNGSWIGQFGHRVTRRRRRVSVALLSGENAGDRRVRARHRARSHDRVGPRLTRRRVARIERRDLREIERVLPSQGPNPRKPAHVDRSAGRSVGERRFR
jgi:hypothetical protein